MVINTPRLCGEPGFSAHFDQRKEAHIRCREVISSQGSDGDEVETGSIVEMSETDRLEESLRPTEKPPRDPILPPPLSFQAPSVQSDVDASIAGGGESMGANIIRRVLESMLTGEAKNTANGQEDTLSSGPVRIINEQGQEEDVWIEVLDAEGLVSVSEDGKIDQSDLENMVSEALNSKLEDVLRAAGYNVAGKKESNVEDEEFEEEENDEPLEAFYNHDEL